MIGFGMISAGNADDPVMGRTYRFATHIQGLLDCPDFELVAVVDPSKMATNNANSRWKIDSVFEKLDDALAVHEDIDVVILATPPQARLDILKKLKNIKGLILEKPIGEDLLQSQDFCELTQALGISVEVNFWRRFVPQFISMKLGELDQRIGKVQGVNVLYGNGLRNNGVHAIDFIRFLIGEFETVQSISSLKLHPVGPISDDCNVAFSATLTNDIPVFFMPLDFSYFRENSVEIIGEKGTLSFLNDGRKIRYTPIKAHEGLANNWELAYEQCVPLPCDNDLAMREIYKHFSAVLRGHQKEKSSIQNALKNEKIVDAVFRSYKLNGQMVHIKK